MNERILYKRFRETLKSELPDAFYWKIPDTRGLGGKRPFDSILILEGRTYCIEFKTKGRKLAAHQRYFLNQAKNAGAEAVVLTENNWRDFIEHLTRRVRSAYRWEEKHA